ncbi:CdaR family protein [Ligilactobacillus ruminis]|uniref:CdaR family protein n=1 Tax=Ligilactobacillus ruminis TaxID=1623 RepID=UPI003F9C2BF9|nr:CdaR family protein [Ligilactobacillus ruminis]
MKFPKIDNTKFLYQLVSLLFALLLFFYVNYQRLGSTRTTDNKTQAPAVLMTNKTVKMTMPLAVNVDNDKYFVTGYPEKVHVKLSGPSAMVKAMDNTRNFEVYADLSKLKSGTHTVKFRTSGLSKEITASIDPDSAVIKIERCKTITMPIQTRYDTGQISRGYAAGTPILSSQTTSITGGQKSIKKIVSVVANVNLPDGTNSAYSKNVILQAIDKNGKTVPDVVISPETVHVTVPINLATSTKTVPLLLEAGAGGVSGKSYNFTSPTKSITLHGTKTALKSISSYRLKVPIVGINSTTTKTIKISPTEAGITSVSPNSLQVTIEVQSSGSQIQSSGSTGSNDSSGSDKQTTTDNDEDNKKDDDSSNINSSSSSSVSSSSED